MRYNNFFTRNSNTYLQAADDTDIEVAKTKEVHGDSKSSEYIFAWTTNLCTGYTDDFCVSPGAPDYVGSAQNMIHHFSVKTRRDDGDDDFNQKLMNINVVLPLDKMYDDAYWEENRADLLAEEAVLTEVLYYTVGLTLLASVLIVILYVNSSRPDALDIFIP